MMIFRVRKKVIAWLKISRFHFYLMSLIGYTIGTIAAYMKLDRFNLGVYILGYIILFLIELCTVFTNEYYDYGSDRINKNNSAFNGGSRMLVEGNITFKEIKVGIVISLCLIFIVGILLVFVADRRAVLSIIVLLFAGLFFGLGYTAPPLKLSYRGLGEIVVGVTHSTYVIICGYVFQSGMWDNPSPWLMSVPLFFATLTAITLSGIPDCSADKIVSKKTIAVIFGSRSAAILSLFFVTVASISGITLWYLKFIGGIVGSTILVVVPHSVILWLAITKLIKSNNYDRKINMIMVLSLSYIIWFGLIPLIYLLKVNSLL